MALAIQEDTATVRRLAVRAVELGRRFGVPELEMVGLGLEGRALVSEGDLTPAGIARISLRQSPERRVRRAAHEEFSLARDRHDDSRPRRNYSRPLSRCRTARWSRPHITDAPSEEPPRTPAARKHASESARARRSEWTTAGAAHISRASPSGENGAPAAAVSRSRTRTRGLLDGVLFRLLA
jgi:hypothetical protein